jgi:hypothetical protein
MPRVDEYAARGLTDLAEMLAGLEPELLPDEYVFASLPGKTLADIAHGEITRLNPIGTFCEAEGLTVILTRGKAIEHELPFVLTLRCITLRVHSDLAAVGLTAAFSAQLAEAGISTMLWRDVFTITSLCLHTTRDAL